MVQFGSFETNDEAQKRLTTVKSAHAAELGSLPASVREVKLPPDNLTVYRTQAGPLASRSDAQSLCSKLASSGDECYVVETAVSGNVVPAAPAVASAASLPPAVAAVSMGNSTNGSALSSAAPIPPAPVAKIDGPALAPLAAPTASPDMQAALDRAATLQNAPATVSENVTPTVVQATSAKPGFWSRMNPFSSSTPKPTAVATATPDVTPVAEPLLAVPTAAATAAAVDATPSSVTYMPSATATSNRIAMPAADDAGPYLLPPPAPLTSQDKQFLETQVAAAPVPPAPVVPPAPPAPPAPHLTAPIALGAPVAPPAPPAPALVPPASVAAAAPITYTPVDTGNVNVGEAKRVPLSDSVLPEVPSVTPAPAAIPLMPSATLGQRTLWAQIGQFKDVQSALNFWQNYRQTHPDFPATRIRVASSLQQQYRGNDKVWLRVGPFARSGFIKNLCSDIGTSKRDDNAQQQYQASNMNCGMIEDTGVATEIRNTPGYLSGSRYKR